MAAGSIVMALAPNIFIDPGTLERGGVCIVKRFRRTLALPVVYCRADARERENGIMRSAANRHAAIALQHPPQKSLFPQLRSPFCRPRNLWPVGRG
jgi:hypothetical protein